MNSIYYVLDNIFNVRYLFFVATNLFCNLKNLFFRKIKQLVDFNIFRLECSVGYFSTNFYKLSIYRKLSNMLCISFNIRYRRSIVSNLCKVCKTTNRILVMGFYDLFFNCQNICRLVMFK